MEKRIVGVDRISSLHDSILCHILSFLPTKYAVGTSILSSRWRYLWSSATALDFSYGNLTKEWSQVSQEKKKELLNTFVKFVNRVLHFGKLQPLRKFYLCCWTEDYPYVLTDIFHSWIDAAICRGVATMNLSLGFWDHVDLPLSIYNCSTLVDLSLSFGIFPHPVSVWLPSLKYLSLHEVWFENLETAQELVSGCPVLEHLYIDRSDWHDETSLNITSPTLERLYLNLADYTGGPVGEEPKRLHIDAPSLDFFRLRDNVSDEFTLLNLSSLLEASVFVGKLCLSPANLSQYLGNLHELFSGMARVETLKLYLFSDFPSLFPIDWSNFRFPIFHKLRELWFHTHGVSGWTSLACFLRSSPKLEILRIVQKDDDDSAAWSPPQHVPECLLSCLEEIKITPFLRRKYELDGIEYLLKNAKKLKEMRIGCTSVEMNEEEVSRLEKLARLPRESGNCQVYFNF